MTDCTHPRSRQANRCRACQLAYLNSPELADRRREGMARHWSNPANVMAAREKIRAVTAATMADPVKLERKREHGRRQFRDHLSRPDVVAKNQAPEVRKRAGAKASATKLRDIPPAMRDEYKRLIRSKLIPAAEAKQIILDQFKRQMGAGKATA